MYSSQSASASGSIASGPSRLGASRPGLSAPGLVKAVHALVKPVRFDQKMPFENMFARLVDEPEKKMNGMNFFTWIRDGVRQSVLLGVSDAIETLGTPASTEDLHPSVAGLLRVDKNVEASPRLAQVGAGGGATGGNGANRKRLGRSLKDIETDTKK